MKIELTLADRTYTLPAPTKIGDSVKITSEEPLIVSVPDAMLGPKNYKLDPNESISFTAVKYTMGQSNGPIDGGLHTSMSGRLIWLLT